MLAQKLALAMLWSLNGLLEKSLLGSRSPQAFATTKALSVATVYLTMQPGTVDVSLLREPAAWLIVFISLCNTPLYAHICAHENPALSLPSIVATSQMLRLVWMTLFWEHDPWTLRRLAGVTLVISGSLCLGG